MELKKQNTLLILLLMISILIIGLLGGFLLANSISKNNSSSDENNTDHNSKTDTNLEENKYLGLYTIKYNENANESIKNDLESSLQLKNDKTFLFVYNACFGMLEVTGNYVIDNNRIILSNLTSGYQEQLETNLNGKTNLEFIIVSQNEIYLNLEENFACTISGNNYGSFVK